MRIDLHVHTAFSACSRLDPVALVEAAAAAGLDGVCVTDHDAMDIRHQLREGVQPNGLTLFFGMEYATPQGDFLLFGPFEQLAPGLDGAGLLEEVARKGGAVVAAHPFRQWRPLCPEIAGSGRRLLVERYNGRNRPEENEAAAALIERHGLRGCAGSDAHCVEELGRCWTRFAARVTTRAQLVDALNNGAYTPEWKTPRATLSHATQSSSLLGYSGPTLRA